MKRSTKNPVGREYLDTLGCQVPGCRNDHGAMSLTGNCHRGAKVHAFYDKHTGVLTLQCSVCAKNVVRVRVAPLDRS